MKLRILIILITGLWLFSCKKKETKAANKDPYHEQKQSLKATYAKLAFAAYDDAVSTAQTLKTALNAFVDAPSGITQQAAKEAWLNAREVYGQTEIFRFVDGPIDNASNGPEGLINAWPMDEAYVDYVVGSPNAGIINNSSAYPTIDAATIVSTNEFGGEENISAGFHAIEFLLWGQDLNENGAGARSYTDYLLSGGSNGNQQRRGQYLKVLGDILLSALTQVRDAWNPNIPSNYEKEFIAMENDLALRKMFNSLRVLSGIELAGERMFVAYQNADQEDEHSCFSDNTHRDIHQNALGIVNLYNGTYTRVDGTVVSGYSLSQLVNTANTSKNIELLQRFETTKNRINAMYVPFDRAITLPDERPKVLDAVNSLKTQQEIIVSIALEFGITF